jgi:hypothetical protein
MATVTVPKFDSSAYDMLTSHLQNLQGLSNCATVLGQCEVAAPGIAGELIDDALPSLGRVMGRLARESEQAADTLWQQNVELRKLLEACHA